MRLHVTTITALATCLLAQTPFANAQAPSGPPAGGPPGGSSAFGEKVAQAKPDEVRVIATGSVQAPIVKVQAQADKAAGKHLAIEYGAARAGLREEIINGQEFELAILVPDVNDELVEKGLAKKQRFEIARIPVGVGYAGDVPPPDISTPAAFKKTLLGAKAVMFNPTGAGAPTANKALSSLGIADSVKRGGTGLSSPPGGGSPPAGGPRPGAGSPPGGGSPLQLGPGEYSISIFPASEIISNRSLKYIGPVIDDFQVPVIAEAVIGAHARDEKAAKAFIDFMRTPEFEEVLKQHGMTKGK